MTRFAYLSSRLTRGRNDRVDVDRSIKVTSAVRHAVSSVPRDRDMTRNTRQSLVPARKSRCDDNGGSDILHIRNALVQARSHAYRRVCANARQRNHPR